LPGGFLNVNETVLDGTIRELKEETKIDCPVAVIRGSVGKYDGVKNLTTKVFDDPDRSLRGRTITHATLFELKPGPLAKIKKSRDPNDVEDDAELAKWIPFTVFDKMEDQLFEDHYHIGQYMIANA
jgi:bifunctional NMN adenylyltransferase/nudix hydrolase